MAFHDFSTSAKQIFLGNILLIICCAFYLTWWLLAFKPVGAIKGIKTGWLLMPAFIFGLAALFLTIKGILYESYAVSLFPSNFLLWAGIIAYLILLAITNILFKRPITSELFLIIGWAVLVLSEINVLYGKGLFTYSPAIIFTVVIVIATFISLVCYVLYYKLGLRTGYFDGMIPLILSALVMAGICINMTIRAS